MRYGQSEMNIERARKRFWSWKQNRSASVVKFLLFVLLVVEFTDLEHQVVLTSVIFVGMDAGCRLALANKS